MVSTLDYFLWAGIPYLTIAIFIVGLVLRFDRDPYGWTSKSSEILEKRLLGIGVLMFHYGFVFVFIGHLMGLIIPDWVYNQIGINDVQYHELSLYGGATAGLVSISGLIILIVRRLRNPRIRAISGIDDFYTLFLLLFVMSAGLANTIGFTLLIGPYEYRTTLGVYIRSLFMLQPQINLMAYAPLSYQVHVLLGLLFFASIPFTRLVHILSFPLPYLWRRYIVFRSLNSKIKRANK
jgi:nitrate reductase gamma subunit